MSGEDSVLSPSSLTLRKVRLTDEKQVQLTEMPPQFNGVVVPDTTNVVQLCAGCNGSLATMSGGVRLHGLHRVRCYTRPRFTDE